MRPAPVRPGRLHLRYESGPRGGISVRRHTARRLSQTPSRRLRPDPLPAASRPGRLRARHPTEGMEEARAAPRLGGQGTIPETGRRRDRATRQPGCAPERDQGLRLQVPPGLFPPRQRAQRGNPTAPCRQPLRRGPPGPLQYQERKEPRPGAVPERGSDLHRRAQEPAERPGREGCDPPVPDRPRPPRAAPVPRPLLGAFRGGPGLGLCDNQARWVVDPGFSPSTRASSAAPATRPSRLPAGASRPDTCGRRPGPATASST